MTIGEVPLIKTTKTWFIDPGLTLTLWSFVIFCYIAMVSKNDDDLIIRDHGIVGI
jgi:hypothetical protein